MTWRFTILFIATVTLGAFAAMAGQAAVGGAGVLVGIATLVLALAALAGLAALGRFVYLDGSRARAHRGARQP